MNNRPICTPPKLILPKNSRPMYNTFSKSVELRQKIADYILQSVKCSSNIYSHGFIPNNKKLLSDQNTALSLEASFNEHIACIVNSFKREDPDNVEQWIKLGKFLGEGVEGLTYSASFRGQYEDLLFAIKTSHIYYDALVGILALNTLRTLVPTFSYIYGYIYGKSIITSGLPAIGSQALFSDNSHSSLLFMENISDSVSLQSFNISNSNILISIITQIINALSIADKIFKFHHNDLHLGNILVRNLSAPLAIPIYIKLDDKPMWLITDWIVSIIDYGTASLEVAGIKFSDPLVNSTDDISKLLTALSSKYADNFSFGEILSIDSLDHDIIIGNLVSDVPIDVYRYGSGEKLTDCAFILKYGFKPVSEFCQDGSISEDALLALDNEEAMARATLEYAKESKSSEVITSLKDWLKNGPECIERLSGSSIIDPNLRKQIQQL